MPTRTENSLTERDYETAPCLRQGNITGPASDAVIASRSMGHSAAASLLRCWAVPYVFDGKEKVFSSGRNPAKGIGRLLLNLSRFFQTAAEMKFSGLAVPSDISPPAGVDTVKGHSGSNALTGMSFDQRTENSNVREVVGAHYGALFSAFNAKSFFDEPLRLLRIRLERNAVDLSRIKDRLVLDAGCGGGRYSVAWRLLGASKVVGLDISSAGIADAKKRMAHLDFDGVEFEQGDVLSLPYPDDGFDIVFSNGVLHHTTDWKTGVSELVRVLRPGGLGWLYLIENPGGLFWDVIEVLRVIMRDENKDLARTVLALYGLPANRIFYMLDHVMVPINVRLSPREIENQLERCGAVDIRRLQRGTDFDRIEQIHRKVPNAVEKYGIGENRYIFSKREPA